MKNLFKNLLLITTVFSLVFLFSCGDEDTDVVTPDSPSVIVDVKVNGTSATSPATAEVGDEISADIDVTAPGTFNVFRVFVVSDGSTIATLELPRTDLNVDDLSDFETSVALMAAVPDSLAGSTVTFEFEVVDDEGQTGSAADFVLEIGEAEPDVNVYTAQLLYAQLESEDSKTFFSTNLGTTVSKNEVDASADPSSSDIDFGYAAGATGTVWLASPSSYPTFTNYDLSIWNDLNTTNFKKVEMTNEEYLAINSSSDLETLYNESEETAADRVTDFAAGDYFSFQLDEDKDGKYGLVNIIAIVDGNEDGDIIDSTDYLEVEVIVQQ